MSQGDHQLRVMPTIGPALTMKNYLLSIYSPDGPPPPPEVLGPIMRDLDEVTKDAQAAGVWVFAGGLAAQSSATVLRQSDGEVLMTDGPYVEAKEHLGGVTVIRVPDLDAALYWAKRYAKALALLPIEVRPFEG